MTPTENTTFRELAKKFATARDPEAGKPLRNNDRLFREESARFGTGYRWEHYDTPIFTLYRTATILHTGCLSSMTSRGRAGHAGLRVSSIREVDFLLLYPQQYIWGERDILVKGKEVYSIFSRIVETPDGGRARGPTEYHRLHPVMKVKAPRKLPKSRNTILDPKVGDAFRQGDKTFIWGVTARHGKPDCLAAYEYLGDNGWAPNYVHLPHLVLKDNISIVLEDDALSQLAYVSSAASMTAIERFTYKTETNELLGV